MAGGWGGSLTDAVLRFACTRCGNCCNRSPEVELSEAAALADDFVFRLMFRLYQAPRSLADYDAGGGEQFYQEKRLLSAFAARKAPVKVQREGRAAEYVQYLVISALALDRATGACSALSDGRCTLHARRPLACRAVPLHYSRAEAALPAYLAEFAATPGYRCDTGDGAPVVLDAGRIVDPATLAARSEALAAAERDRPWKEAIVRRLKSASVEGLPSLREIEANARIGATTTSMRAAWHIAAQAGLLTDDGYRSLVARQLAVIDRELSLDAGVADARETLVQMRAEYAARL